MLIEARFDPSLDAPAHDFARSLLKRATEAAGVESDEKVRAAQGVGIYGNYASKCTCPTIIPSQVP